MESLKKRLGHIPSTIVGIILILIGCAFGYFTKEYTVTSTIVLIGGGFLGYKPNNVS